MVGLMDLGGRILHMGIFRHLLHTAVDSDSDSKQAIFSFCISAWPAGLYMGIWVRGIHTQYYSLLPTVARQ